MLRLDTHLRVKFFKCNLRVKFVKVFLKFCRIKKIDKTAAELKVAMIVEDCTLMNILNSLTLLRLSTGVRVAPKSKEYTEKLYCVCISINTDFYAKILLINVKVHEILFKMVSLILVLESLLIQIIAEEIAMLKLFKNKTYSENAKRKSSLSELSISKILLDKFMQSFTL